ALHWAAYRDDLESARLLIQAGANVKAATRLGDYTPLFLAAKNGNAAMIELLVTTGSEVDTPNKAGTTALMLAAASGRADAVKVLLDNGANINATDTVNGQTALMFAAAVNASPTIKLLAERGADLNAVSKVLMPRDPNEKRDGINPNRRTMQGPWLGGLTALHFAAREGQFDAVRELVAGGADVNVVAATDKMSPITTAIINGHFDIGKFLLDNGANPNLANTGGLTPLFAAIDQGWAARTWYPAASSEQQKTTHLELMKALLERGANPNARMGPKLWFRTFHGDWVDPDGATAFWRAAQANDIPAMRMLVAAGADPHIPTAHGCSPLQVAAGFGYQPQTSNFAPDARPAAVKYLVEETGADVNSKDDKGYTPLHGAALMNSKDLINYLVARGANIKARANMIYGRNSDTDQAAAPGMGDTVADMANGPREWNLQYPEIVEHLVKLGSEFSDNCKAAQCVQKTRPDRPPGK
ncbi:MAG: ankyrin repeat domain-containing protein, partial [Acidobacteria bacterium]|nr:ankyrin repeat domain-containing protein [Acidobacteriota bacterium]